MAVYSLDNTIGELISNDNAREILNSVLPQLVNNLRLEQVKDIPMRMILQFAGGAIPPAVLETIEKELEQIPREEITLPEVEDPGAPYFDAQLPINERVEDLLSRMTTAEKLAQLCSDMPNDLLGAAPASLAAKLAQKHSHGIGRYTQYSIVGMGRPREAAEIGNAVQEYFCKHTRLGIPAMLQSENLSGYPGSGGTIFPAMIGAAATFDESLVEKMAEIIGQETRAVGVAQGLSPVLDLAQDPRWGRVYETFGEDPYLVSQMGMAYVHGMQGDKHKGCLATGKHFLGYSVTQAGLNTAATRLGSRELYDDFATPFEAAMRGSGLSAVMTSYSEIDGIPCGANKKIARELLRNKLGFDGLVVSDGGAVWKMYDTYRIASSYEEAGFLAIKGGIETEMPVGDSFRKLDRYLENGQLDIGTVDHAVRHVLKTKFEAGLFENPYVDADEAEKVMTRESSRQISRQVAEESIVLLENDGILPLESGSRLAVVGPHGNRIRPVISGYTFPAYYEMVHSIAGSSAVDVTFNGMIDEKKKAEEGITKEPVMDILMTGNFDMEAMLREKCGGTTLAEELAHSFPVATAIGCEVSGMDRSGFNQAVQAAENADTVILTLGGNCGWVGTTSGEGRDRTSLALPGVQQELLEKVCAVGKPVILVLYGSAGYTPVLPSNVRAVIYAWLPGPFGGKAVSDILCGIKEPVGRLPITLPRCAGQIPIYYYHRAGSGFQQVDSVVPHKGAMPTIVDDHMKEAINLSGGYTDCAATPLYPFGYGLSYTQFTIDDFQVSPMPVSTEQTVHLSCKVKNVGSRAGTAVIQLYVRDMEAHVTRPIRQLCGYARVSLKASQEANIFFDVDAAQFGFTNEDDRFVVEPGTFRFMIGQNSRDISNVADIVLSGDVRELSGQRSYTCRVKIDKTS